MTARMQVAFVGLDSGHSTESSGLMQAMDGSLCVRFQAGPGLYQFSVVLDGKEFDWDRLYVEMNAFGNKGQRTGPWDFSPVAGHVPLVPSYWVELDGHVLGQWFMQRVSLEDLAQRRFRGRMAFALRSSGRHELRFRAHGKFAVQWASARLEEDPEDSLAPVPACLRPAGPDLPAARWNDPDFWRQKRACLRSTHAMYRRPLRQAFRWVINQTAPRQIARTPLAFSDDLALLIAAYRLGGSSAAGRRIVLLADALTNAPAWGNANKNAYGHNGDMNVAAAMRQLAWACHMVPDLLGLRRRRRILRKLQKQGNLFYDLVLLNRDYWGGSVLQGHGWVSLFGFGTAALNLYGILPDAKRWLEYVMPRLQRSLEVLAPDGVTPQLVHRGLRNYLVELTSYAETLRALGGPDILALEPLRRVIDFTCAVVRPEKHLLVATANQCVPQHQEYGGHEFFNLVASRYGDGRAAWLNRLLISTPPACLPGVALGRAFRCLIWGFLSFDPAVAPTPPHFDPRRLTHFEDAGLVHYRDEKHDVTVVAQCGPFSGYHAYRRLSGPCDRLAGAPIAGHFSVLIGEEPMLTSVEGAYRLSSMSGSILLVDGRGQIGDVGYPMSIPSEPWHGESVRATRWDPEAGSGFAELDLKPAYPREAGLVIYTRAFHFRRNGGMICRDHVVLDRPRRLSWLFQYRRSSGIAWDGLAARIGGRRGLLIRPRAVGVKLQAETAPTETVWSYASYTGYAAVDHIRYDSQAPASTALVDFAFQWRAFKE